MIEIGARDVLLVVDVQNDFCSGGALAVPGGQEVIPVINRLARKFGHVVLTQDWHPAGHSSFASSHPHRQPYETIPLPYGPQVLWPDHCIQGSEGAAFHADLCVGDAALILRKGRNPAIDSYSAFFENDHLTPTGLGGYLREIRAERVVVVGLALDFCVRYSAEDGRRQGFSVLVLEDACRGIDIGGSVAEARRSLGEMDIPCLTEQSIR